MKRLLPFLLLILSSSAKALDPDYIFGDATTKPGYSVFRARGHFAGKERLYSGDVMNGIYGRGWNGSAYSNSDGSAIEIQANETWSTTGNGTKILFKTVPVGSVTSATVGTFQSDGGFLPFSRTEAQLKASTPTAVGALYYDSTNLEIVRSTGITTCLSYSKIEDSTAVPDGW